MVEEDGGCHAVVGLLDAALDLELGSPFVVCGVCHAAVDLAEGDLDLALADCVEATGGDHRSAAGMSLRNKLPAELEDLQE